MFGVAQRVSKSAARIDAPDAGPNLAAPERLESRDLMASSPLGFSLPDLTITGSAGTRAAWGGTLGITATVINQGSSTITNPIAQAPGP